VIGTSDSDRQEVILIGKKRSAKSDSDRQKNDSDRQESDSDRQKVILIGRK
jgi:hypothetical protein